MLMLESVVQYKVRYFPLASSKHKKTMLQNKKFLQKKKISVKFLLLLVIFSINFGSSALSTAITHRPYQSFYKEGGRENFRLQLTQFAPPVDRRLPGSASPPGWLILLAEDLSSLQFLRHLFTAATSISIIALVAYFVAYILQRHHRHRLEKIRAIENKEKRDAAIKSVLGSYYYPYTREPLEVQLNWHWHYEQVSYSHWRYAVIALFLVGAIGSAWLVWCINGLVVHEQIIFLWIEAGIGVGICSSVFLLLAANLEDNAVKQICIKISAFLLMMETYVFSLYGLWRMGIIQ